MFGSEEEPRLYARPVKKRAPRILLAEDDVEMLRYLEEALGKAGYEVIVAEHGIRALDYIAASLITGERIDVDVVVSDIRMPGADGLRLLSALRSHDHSLPVILITAFGNAETHAEASRRGAAAVLDKPFAFSELLALIRSVSKGGGRPEPGGASNDRNDAN